MMYRIQKDLSLAYGLVMDSEKKVRCMRLNNLGMTEVEGCPHDCQAGQSRDAVCKLYYIIYRRLIGWENWGYLMHAI